MGCVFRKLSITQSLTFYLQGAFDSFAHEHLPRTKYDIHVDESSNKPGEQAFEVSAKYEGLLDQLLTIFSEEINFWSILGRNHEIGDL
jgi:hexokinase